MTSDLRDLAAEALRLNDDEYFALSESRRIAVADAFAEAADDDAISDRSRLPARLALGAPQRVDLPARGHAPVLLGQFQTGLRSWQVSLQPNLRLFVKNLATGDLLQSTPMVSMRRGLAPLPSGAGEPPRGSKASTTSASVTTIDLMERMGERLKTGELAITAVVFDTRSNTAHMRIDGAHPPTPPVPVPAPVRPAYMHSDLDARPSLDREIVVPQTASAKAGFRIRVAAQMAEEEGILRTALNQPFLPAHVVLVQLDKPAIVVKAAPPVQPVKGASGEQRFNALFLVAFGGTDGLTVAPGDYRVYLDLGREFVGPYPLKVGE